VINPLQLLLLLSLLLGCIAVALLVGAVLDDADGRYDHLHKD